MKKLGFLFIFLSFQAADASCWNLYLTSRWLVSPVARQRIFELTRDLRKADQYIHSRFNKSLILGVPAYEYLKEVQNVLDRAGYSYLYERDLEIRILAWLAYVPKFLQPVFSSVELPLEFGLKIANETFDLAAFDTADILDRLIVGKDVVLAASAAHFVVNVEHSIRHAYYQLDQNRTVWNKGGCRLKNYPFHHTTDRRLADRLAGLFEN